MSTFQPVIMFEPTSQADHLAVAMVQSLHADIAETMNTARNRQTMIGVSEIGMECLKCLARKLNGHKIDSANWKAQVGTFIHAGMEIHFGGKYGNAADPHDVPPEITPTDVSPLYHLERKVELARHARRNGTIWVLAGSCDLYIQGASFGIIDDWKTQNSKKLAEKTSKGDIGNTYTVQMMGYGLGYELLGFPVTHVLLYALPRDGDLDDAKPVLMRYDRQVAVDAIARATAMLDAGDLMEEAYPGAGWAMFIEQQPKAKWCFDCKRYEAAESGDFFEGMFG